MEIGVTFESSPSSGSGSSGSGSGSSGLQPTDSNAQVNLGFTYENKKDYKETAKWYRKAAEQGNAYGQNNLGWLYLHGNGVLKNDKEAEKWLRKSADQGKGYGQYNLGSLIEKKALALGTNTLDVNVLDPQLINSALKYYAKAALQGHEGVQAKMGQFYDPNQTLVRYPWPKSAKLAYAWYSISGLNGSAAHSDWTKKR